jgi:hypothetical protein
MTNPFSTPQPGRAWRWIALAFWSLIALAFLAFFWLDLRLDYIQLLTPCQGAECNWMAISSAEVEILHSWGLSTQTYAAFMTGAAVVTVAVYWLLGGLLLWRQGATRIGLSVSLVMLVIPITLISDSGNVYESIPGLLIPWVFLSALGRIFILLFIYLFPNGRLYPRWAIIFLGAAIFFTVISTVLEITGFGFFSRVQVSLLLATAALMFLGGIFQIFRYLRSSTLIERQQTKWALLGIIILILSVPVWILFFGGGLNISPGVPRLLGSLSGWLLTMLLIAALTVAITIAILRYRLWDIDVIIRRTLVYGSLTITLALVYFGSVLLLQGLFEAISGQRSAVSVVISTLVIAALFNPLRRRIQNDIDRRFFRQKYDAEKVVAAFSAGLREEVDLEDLQAQIVAVVQETLQPEQVSLWLKETYKDYRK